jgi:catechol 2,3-dioxygenase-like lactoylglutathione lyase family enzyme
MLKETDATAMLAVKDIANARAFYEGTLGFEPDTQDEDGMVSYRSGRTPIMLYESAYAGTNQANALAWSVDDDFDTIFKELATNGVTFEHYDLPGLTLDGDVHVADGFKGVWFKDPDGNILHINGR